MALQRLELQAAGVCTSLTRVRVMLVSMASSDMNPQPRLDDPSPGAHPASTILSCPYLSSADRAWVATGPAREHRCEAVTPAAALSTEKQRRLCLTADHETCATYLAARAAREGRGESTADGSLGWGWVRTTPVVDRSVGMGASLAAVITERLNVVLAARDTQAELGADVTSVAGGASRLGREGWAQRESTSS